MTPITRNPPPEALVTRPKVEAFCWGIEQSDFLQINFAVGHRQLVYIRWRQAGHRVFVVRGMIA
jgi:hypothetical protein